MTTHLFIVDKDTFPAHLKYMFAGTGKGDGEENIGMISDVSGCRIGDKILFYLTQDTAEKRDGKFFGVFEVASKPFWQKKGDYLYEELGKRRLTNRVLIKPFLVYPKGVSEWDTLDNLDNLSNGKNSKVNELIWSLIYRKLEGNRGCTPIFDYEFNQILRLIKAENKEKSLNLSKNYQFNNEEIKILNNDLVYDESKISNKDFIPLTDDNGNTYSVKEKIIKVRNGQFKYKRKYKQEERICIQHKCEEELEYFFVSNIGFNIEINKITGKPEDLYFWGSQIFAGVGKRRIDVLTLSNKGELRIIELKDEEFDEYQLNQILKYIKWARQYIREPKDKKIVPILVVNSISNAKEKLLSFNKELKDCEPIKVFIWKIKDNNIIFEEFDYNAR